MTLKPYTPNVETRFRKTITETDMVLFAGITGDFAPNHMDEEYMRKSPFGTRQVHGAFLVGLMSAVAAQALQDARPEGLVPVSSGYDSLRFLKPIYPGDTVEMSYVFDGDFDPARMRVKASVQGRVAGELVAVGKHVVVWVKEDSGVNLGQNQETQKGA